jgi:TPP-dependent 2-oxoacid decarboxylase
MSRDDRFWEEQKQAVQDRDERIIEMHGIKIEISEELAQNLDMPEALKDLRRTCARIVNRYSK